RNYLNLFDLDKDAACQHLMDWIGRVGKPRVKPGHEPPFPGTAQTQKSGAPERIEPNFPGRMPRIFRLPARNRNFTGREALLDKLGNQLAVGRVAALTAATGQVAAYGLGGAGKSQLAIEYAWRWASDYWGIIWLQAETPETLGRDFDALAVDLGLFSRN